MKRMHVLAPLACVALVACAPNDGVTFLKQPDATPDATVKLAPGTTTTDIANKLRAMGFGIGRVTDTTVSAAGRGGAFVNCGRIRQTRDGNSSIYPASTPLSVLYSEDDTQKFLTRQIAVLTRADVSLSGTEATVSERHEITMLWTASDGTGMKRESKAVDGNETVTFEDGTKCATGTLIAENLK
ncbi:MAG: hypothetical protein AAGK71_11750 [Pseudomonadota bacterium]